MLVLPSPVFLAISETLCRRMTSPLASQIAVMSDDCGALLIRFSSVSLRSTFSIVGFWDIEHSAKKAGD
jgi:hypothetical protein